MKEAKRQAKPKKLFHWMLLCIVCLIGVYMLLRSDLFLIKSVEVFNNERVSTAAVESLGDIEIGSNIFQIDRELTAKKIELHQLIKHAEVKRKLPSTIQVTVEERQPWAQLMVRDRCILIDDAGVYMEDVNHLMDDPTLLLITLDDTYSEPLNFGQPICPEAAAMVKRVYEALTPEFCREEISEYLYLTEEKSLVIYTMAGTEVRFGDLDRLELKISYMQEIQKKEKETEATGKNGIMYVDMRFEGMPSIRDL